MKEAQDSQIYDERTPFYKAGLSSSVMPEKLRDIFWHNQITDLASLYVVLSNFPEPFQTLCDLFQVDFDDLKQEVTDRLSGDFLRRVGNTRDDLQCLLNPLMQRFSRYIQYCDLLTIPGVVDFREYEHFTNGRILAVTVSMSQSDPTTALLLPKIHQKTGVPIQLLHEH